MSDNRTSAQFGVGIGAILAGLISWGLTKSLLWNVLHIVGGWIYVFYSLWKGRIHW